MENFDVSSLQEEALRNIEADSFWCMSKLLDGIQVSMCVRKRFRLSQIKRPTSLYFQTKKEHKLNLPQSPPTMFTGLASLLSHIKLNYVSRLCFEYVLRPSTCPEIINCMHSVECYSVYGLMSILL